MLLNNKHRWIPIYFSITVSAQSPTPTQTHKHLHTHTHKTHKHTVAHTTHKHLHTHTHTHTHTNTLSLPGFVSLLLQVDSSGKHFNVYQNPYDGNPEEWLRYSPTVSLHLLLHVSFHFVPLPPSPSCFNLIFSPSLNFPPPSPKFDASQFKHQFEKILLGVHPSAPDMPRKQCGTCLSLLTCTCCRATFPSSWMIGDTEATDVVGFRFWFWCWLHSFSTHAFKIKLNFQFNLNMASTPPRSSSTSLRCHTPLPPLRSNVACVCS